MSAMRSVNLNRIIWCCERVGLVAQPQVTVCDVQAHQRAGFQMPALLATKMKRRRNEDGGEGPGIGASAGHPVGNQVAADLHCVATRLKIKLVARSDGDVDGAQGDGVKLFSAGTRGECFLEVSQCEDVRFRQCLRKDFGICQGPGHIDRLRRGRCGAGAAHAAGARSVADLAITRRMAWARMAASHGCDWSTGADSPIAATSNPSIMPLSAAAGSSSFIT